MAPVRVVPESHAALMHARDQKQFSGKELQGTVLVVDLGSSTTDYTVLHGLKEGKGLAQHGYDLGASLIDKAILAHTLAQHPECEQIEALWERHASLRNRCELFCREAKEEYFKNWDYYQNTPYTSALGKPEPFQGLLNKPFRPEVTRELMDQILREPMPELNNQSWPDAFYNQLLNIKHEMKQELDVVLVTGGASRMPFIEEACQQVFPNTRLILDSVPELAIAEGLARWGRVDVRACRFQADVDNLLQKELPHQVSEKLDQLAAKIATNLAGSLITNVIKPDVLKWRDDGSYATLKEMESKMNRHIKAWLGSSHAKNDVTQQVQAWFRKSIYLWLQGKLEKLADQYDLPDAALKLSPAEVEFSADKLPFVNILDSTMGEFNDTVDVIVAVVLGVIIITIIAVSATIGGPLAWLVGFAGWLIGGAVISEGIREQVKSQDIPKWVRPNIIGDDKLNQKLAEERPKLEEAIKNIFNTDTSRSKMATSITKEVQAYVREKTDIARLLIT
jgi:hypothetical protein